MAGTRKGVADLPPGDCWQIRDALHRSLDGAETVSALAGIAADFPGFQAAMQRQAADAVEQGRQISALTDLLTRRLVALSLPALPTPAPGPWAWLACGSQGRSEQTVHTDQDNALIYADGLPASADDWFRRLAERVSDGLVRCGLPQCPGGVGPAGEDWRRSVTGWREALADVVRYPERKAVMLATHYLDLRTVFGEESLFEPLRRNALIRAGGNSRFMARLREAANRPAPPLGLFGRIRRPWFGPMAGHVDIKQGGILPLVQIVRCHAVRAGLPQLHTIDRIHGVVREGLLRAETAAELERAYRTLVGLRARFHAEAIEQGQRLANQLPLADMTPDEKADLRRAFRCIRLMQSVQRQAVLGEGL